MNYELYMSAAMAEARAAAAAGESPDGAVAVVDEALVARGRAQTRASGDPTAHSVMVVVREAARRLGRIHLNGVTVFTVVEPCAMCVGALLEADADSLVFAASDPKSGATTALASGRLTIVSGIMQREAAELLASSRQPVARPAARA